MEELIKKIKLYFKDVDNKNLINRMFIALALSILLLILLNIFTSRNKNIKSSVIKEQEHEYTNVAEIEDYSIILENRLESILGKFSGLDKVHVMITLEDGLEKIPATNKSSNIETTKEVDAEGGEREIKKEDEHNELLSLSDDIVILKEIQPSVKGVIVLVEEIEDGIVLENIYEAVKTVLGVSANRVQVFTNK